MILKTEDGHQGLMTQMMTTLLVVHSDLSLASFLGILLPAEKPEIYLPAYILFCMSGCQSGYMNIAQPENMQQKFSNCRPLIRVL